MEMYIQADNAFLEWMVKMSKNVVHIADAWYAAVKWADSHPNWIPVEEELPKLTIDGWRSEDVFFATDDGKSHFGFYSNKGVWFSSVYGFNGHQVTHWMSLPTPPAPRKEESNERG